MPLIGSGLLSAGSAPAFVGAYDGISNLAAVYSVRSVLSSYTGPLLRLRRDSDNAESDFGYVAATGDLDTAAIATWLGAATGYVTTWYDQGTSGLNATMTTASYQPAYVASGLNSKPAPKFDGVNDALEHVGLPFSDYPFSVIATVNADVNRLAGVFFVSADGNGAENTGTIYGICTTATTLDVRTRTNDGPQGIATVAYSNNASIISGILAGDSSRTAYNNGTAGTTNTTTVDFDVADADRINIGRFYPPVSYDAVEFGGQILEIVLISAVVPTADHNTIGASMASYYGLTWNTIA